MGKILESLGLLFAVLSFSWFTRYTKVASNTMAERYLVVDTESSVCRERRQRVLVSVAYEVIDVLGEVHASCYAIVRFPSGLVLDEESTAVHGITQEMLCRPQPPSLPGSAASIATGRSSARARAPGLLDLRSPPSTGGHRRPRRRRRRDQGLPLGAPLLGQSSSSARCWPVGSPSNPPHRPSPDLLRASGSGLPR